MNEILRILSALAAVLLAFGAASRPAAAQAALLSPQPAIPKPQPIPLPVPEWVRRAVIYEVNPGVFSASGDFNGIRGRLPDLQRLGVTTLWLMPIHPVGVVKSFGSPYCVRDYFAINPKLGTAADLHRLIGAVHGRGMKVILDMVFGHTAWDNPLLTQHPDFYQHDAQGSIIFPPNTEWKDVAALDYTNPGLRDYMTQIMPYWLRQFDVDGFRCDAAGRMPTDFWEQARTAAEKVKPGLLMLDEADDPALLARAFDVDYDFSLLNGLDKVITQNAPASDLQTILEQERTRFPSRALHMQIADDHDVQRATVRFGPDGARAASVLTLTLDGVPLLYNGMEVADTGKSPIVWNGPEQFETFRFYQQMLTLRRSHPALQQGQTLWLPNSDAAHLLTYLRRGDRKEFLVAVNLSKNSVQGTVDIKTSGIPWRDVTPAWMGADVEKKLPGPPLPALSLKAYGFCLFERRL